MSVSDNSGSCVVSVEDFRRQGHDVLSSINFDNLLRGGYPANHMRELAGSIEELEMDEGLQEDYMSSFETEQFESVEELHGSFLVSALLRSPPNWPVSRLVDDDTGGFYYGCRNCEAKYDVVFSKAGTAPRLYLPVKLVERIGCSCRVTNTLFRYNSFRRTLARRYTEPHQPLSELLQFLIFRCHLPVKSIHHTRVNRQEEGIDTSDHFDLRFWLAATPLSIEIAGWDDGDNGMTYVFRRIYRAATHDVGDSCRECPLLNSQGVPNNNDSDSDYDDNPFIREEGWKEDSNEKGNCHHCGVMGQAVPIIIIRCIPNHTHTLCERCFQGYVASRGAAGKGGFGSFCVDHKKYPICPHPGCSRACSPRIEIPCLNLVADMVVPSAFVGNRALYFSRPPTYLMDSHDSRVLPVALWQEQLVVLVGRVRRRMQTLHPPSSDGEKEEYNRCRARLSAYKLFSDGVRLKTPEYMRSAHAAYLAPLIWDYEGFDLRAIKKELDECIERTYNNMATSIPENG